MSQISDLEAKKNVNPSITRLTFIFVNEKDAPSQMMGE